MQLQFASTTAGCILNAFQDQKRSGDSEEIIMLEVKVAMMELFFSLIIQR
jgi:hypothetical protein